MHQMEIVLVVSVAGPDGWLLEVCEAVITFKNSLAVLI